MLVRASYSCRQAGGSVDWLSLRNTIDENENWNEEVMIKYNIVNWMLSDDCKVVKCFLLFKVENHNGEFANLFFLKREKQDDNISWRIFKLLLAFQQVQNNCMFIYEITVKDIYRNQRQNLIFIEDPFPELLKFTKILYA